MVQINYSVQVTSENIGPHDPPPTDKRTSQVFLGNYLKRQSAISSGKLYKSRIHAGFVGLLGASIKSYLCDITI